MWFAFRSVKKETKVKLLTDYLFVFDRDCRIFRRIMNKLTFYGTK